MGVGAIFVVLLFVLETVGQVAIGQLNLVIAACGALTCSFLAYLIWTHLIFGRTPPSEASRIGAAQHHQGASSLARLLGFGSTESWAISAAGAALLGAIAAVIFGATDGGAVLTPFALLTAAAAWVTVVYAFGLRYFRMHSAGERFGFDFDDEPRFTDFISMAIMISSAGALSAASPRACLTKFLPMR